MKIGVLHPGAMGASVGAALVAAGHDAFFVTEGRSGATLDRAERAGLVPVPALTDLLSVCEAVISVCPPHAAIEVAEAVSAAGFRGTYLDANAVAPETARRLAERVGRAFVDGGIIGPPAWKSGSTRLYVSGEQATAVPAWFDGSPLDVRIVPGPAGAASALKMCYAAWTKGSGALLLNVRALAVAEGVEGDLLGEWDLSQPGLAERSAATARGSAGKAWRFVGEMEEIASTFAENELPDGFHRAAAAVYARLHGLKDRADVDLEEVLRVLLEADPDV